MKAGPFPFLSFFVLSCLGLSAGNEVPLSELVIDSVADGCLGVEEDFLLELEEEVLCRFEMDDVFALVVLFFPAMLKLVKLSSS